MIEKLKGRLTISKDSKAKVCIRVEDKTSGIDFLEIELSLNDFAEGLFGLVARPCIFSLRGAHNVGKECISEKFEFEVNDSYSTRREEAKQKVEELNQISEDGWIYNSYFGTQSSFRKDKATGKTYAVTTRTKYI